MNLMPMLHTDMNKSHPTCPCGCTSPKEQGQQLAKDRLPLPLESKLGFLWPWLWRSNVSRYGYQMVRFAVSDVFIAPHQVANVSRERGVIPVPLRVEAVQVKATQDTDGKANSLMLVEFLRCLYVF